MIIEGVERSGDNRIVLVGRGSNLGKSIQRCWGSLIDFDALSLTEIAGMSFAESRNLVLERSYGASAVIWLGAILDFTKSPAEIERVNFSLPMGAAGALYDAGYSGRFLTIGSALEELIPDNPYFYWKRRLAFEAEDESFRGLDWMHVRVHTIVGKQKPREESFLGQLVHALGHSAVFSMHGKSQVRRFQDETELAMALVSEIALGDFETRVLTLGPRESVNLYELASEASALSDPPLQIQVDSSGAWEDDQTAGRLVNNDREIAGGLDIQAMLKRIREWAEL